MGMQGFSDAFKSPEHYILDITYRIWEMRGLDLIRDWYSADCPVKTPMSFSVGVEPVIAGTQATLDQFPDRELLADDIMIGHWTMKPFTRHTASVPPVPIKVTDCSDRLAAKKSPC